MPAKRLSTAALAAAEEQPVMRITHPATDAEQARLDDLASFEVLDTGPDAHLDGLTRLAAIICGTSMSSISLIDAERQWSKSRVGLEGPPEVPRSIAFCNYAIQEPDQLLEVADATQDTRFADNPLVTGNPNIRFYAGAPLVSSTGYALGTLCTLHTVPLTLTGQQREALQILAQEVTTHLELRRTQLQLEQEKKKLEGLLALSNSTNQALFTNGRSEIFVKHEQRLLRVNLTDIQYVEALGDYVNIYTNQERLTVYTTMKEMELKLPLRDFARVQRKYIVRVGAICAIEGDTVITRNAKGDVYIPIGSSFKQGLLNRLNLI